MRTPDQGSCSNFSAETIGKDVKERTLRCENVCYKGKCGQMGGKLWGKNIKVKRKKERREKNEEIGNLCNSMLQWKNVKKAVIKLCLSGRKALSNKELIFLYCKE